MSDLETMARRFFPDEDPIGKRLDISGPTYMREIVGVVGDTRWQDPSQPARAVIYAASSQGFGNSPAILARTSVDELSLASTLRTILHERNLGRGASVSDGFRAARGEIAGYIDVDLEVHSRYIPSLVRAIERGADVATLQRIYAFQVRSLDRYAMCRGYSFLVRRMLAVELRDTETGYKFFRRARALPLLDEIEDSGWFWDTEFMVRAVRRGLRVVEVPGAYIRRADKTSTVRGVRDSLRYFSRLVRFRRKLQGSLEGAR